MAASSPRDRWTPLKATAVLLISGATAVLLRSALDPVMGDGYPFIFAFAAVALSAAVGGWVFGVAATLLNFVAVGWFFIPPRGALTLLQDTNEAWAFASFCLTSGIITWLAHNARQSARDSRGTALALAAERERLQVTLRSIGDAVVATDANGIVTFLNPVAEVLTGWSNETAIGRPLGEIFRIVNEQTRLPVESPVDKVLVDGRVVGLANHTVLIAKDGAEHAIADSAAPIRTAEGVIAGVVLVFRDVSGEREDELLQERRRERAELLSVELESLLTTRETGEIVREISPRLMNHLDAQVYFHFCADPGEPGLRLESWGGLTDEETALVRTVDVGKSLCRNGPQPPAQDAGLNADGLSENDAAIVRALGLQAYACHPLKSGGRLLGTLSFGSRTRARFDADELELIRTVAQHLALALDRLESDRALRARESQLAEQARLLNLTNDGVIVCDWQHHIVYWNRGAEGIYGWSAHEAIGRVKYELLESEFPRPLPEIMATLERENRWQGELVHTRKDGRRIVVSTRWVLDRDSKGAPAFVLKSDNDITERKEAEEGLRKSRQQLQLIADNIPALVSYIDRGLVYRFANAVYARWFGAEPKEIIGRTVADLLTPNIYAHRLPYMHAALRGEEVRFEGPAEHSLLGPRETEVMYIPDRSNGSEVPGFYVFLQDVTERRRAQKVLEQQAHELREGNKRKDEFLAMLAHELRNPLASASNATALLQVSEDQETRTWAQEVIARQISHLGKLIDDLLDVSRITSGKIRLQVALVDAASIIRRVVEGVTPLVQQRRHRLDVEIEDEGRPLLIEADPTRLEQIVSNLLTNAVKYTEIGGAIHLAVRRERNADQATMLSVCVSDTGIGIAPEKIAEMFELFAQGERSIARSEGGLGIGLTLVKKLTEMHGGTVTARSDGIGKGSEFIVRFPIDSRRTTSPIRDRGPAVTHLDAGKVLTGATVLVVDDNEDTTGGLARLLTSWGCQTSVAHDGHQAIAVAREFAPAIVLLDIGLPGVDGYEVCRRLRQEPRCKEALIIAISGYGQDEDRRCSKEAGFDHHLIKPVDLEELRRLLVESFQAFKPYMDRQSPASDQQGT
jgi:PAS domain S-box-containing protein